MSACGNKDVFSKVIYKLGVLVYNLIFRDALIEVLIVANNNLFLFFYRSSGFFKD